MKDVNIFYEDINCHHIWRFLMQQLAVFLHTKITIAINALAPTTMMPQLSQNARNHYKSE